MIRLIGGCMILSGCFGLGIWYREQFVGRLKMLGELQKLLELLAAEIRYGRATLPECCRNTGKYLQEPFSGILTAISERMDRNFGDSFGEVFREEMLPQLKKMPLKEEDVENFLRFTNQSGFADGQMQVRTLEQSMELLHGTEEKLQQENAEKCRMAVGLGAMSGLLLILILW